MDTHENEIFEEIKKDFGHTGLRLTGSWFTPALANDVGQNYVLFSVNHFLNLTVAIFTLPNHRFQTKIEYNPSFTQLEQIFKSINLQIQWNYSIGIGSVKKNCLMREYMKMMTKMMMKMRLTMMKTRNPAKKMSSWGHH